MTQFYRRLPRARADATLAAFPSTLVFLAGIWMMVAPVSFNYRDVGFVGLYPYWNEIVVGGALAAAALVRVATATTTPDLSLANVALGAWLIISPFLFGLEDQTLPLVWNNAIVGLLVIVLSLMSWILSGGKQGLDEATREG